MHAPCCTHHVLTAYSPSAGYPQDDELFISFIGTLLRLHPDDRPTAEQALQHPFIVGEGTAGTTTTTTTTTKQQQ